jgi:uncharacterized protein
VLEQRLEALMGGCRATKLVVAFSGGADSAFLLAAARAIGPANVVAATAISPSLPS